MTPNGHSTATYYTAEVGHEKQGPWTYDQVAAMVLGGHCTPATLWWRPGMPQWQRICTFPLPTKSYNPFNAFLAGMRRAVLFSGRSCRAEFWFFLLGVVLLFIALAIVGACTTHASLAFQESLSLFCLALMVYCGVALLAAAARRLHDAGLTTLLLLFLLVPLFGPIGLLPFIVFPSQDTANRHGPRPLLPDE